MFGFGSKSSTPETTSDPELDLSSSPGTPVTSFNNIPAGGLGSGSEDRELQRILMIEQQRAQFQAQVHKFNDICWEVCVDKPSSRLDSKTETCLVNCVDRFIDVSLAITNRFAQLLQQKGGF